MKTLYQDNSNDPKYNAQRALSGRTHYVDDATLKFHKCRILSAHSQANGLLFSLITSDALDMHNTRRGFRYVVFDLFGTIISRQSLEESVNSSKQAKAALKEYLATVDALKLTHKGIARDKKQTKYEREYLQKEIKNIKKEKQK